MVKKESEIQLFARVMYFYLKLLYNSILTPSIQLNFIKSNYFEWLILISSLINWESSEEKEIIVTFPLTFVTVVINWITRSDNWIFYLVFNEDIFKKENFSMLKFSI